MLLIDTNITSDVYCHYQMGYDMVCYPTVIMAIDGAQGGLGLAVRDDLTAHHVWPMEACQLHAPSLGPLSDDQS